MRHLSLLAALGLSVASGPASAQSPACAPDNGGLTLPRGFCATVVAESLGPVRHLVVAPNGDLWAARNGAEGGLVLIRDTNGDGKDDLVKRFWGARRGGAGSGIALAGDALEFASNDQVRRFAWPAGKAEADSVAQVSLRGLGRVPRGAESRWPATRCISRPTTRCSGSPGPRGRQSPIRCRK